MQEAIVAILVLSALAYLGWRFYLRLNKKTDCGPECGCEAEVLPKRQA